MTFRIQCNISAWLNTLTLTLLGLEIDNIPITARSTGLSQVRKWPT